MAKHRFLRTHPFLQTHRFLYLLPLVLALLMVMAACTSGASVAPLPTLSASPAAKAPPVSGGSAAAVSIDLTAQNIAFDKTSISVPAGAAVTIVLNNKDAGVPHNFSVYTDSSAATNIFKGDPINGPGTVRYQFTAPTTPGTYFFRCDIHPSQMTGQFVVTPQ